MRPLNFYTPGSSRYDDITDEYLWGRDLLVAPVLTQGAKERKVIFPDGEWLDIKAPANIYHGGDTISYAAPLEVLPLFVRGGAFIPTADYKMENTGDYRTDRYTINYYPTQGKSTYTLFEDDMQSTTSLSTGDYGLIEFEGDATSSYINIGVTTSGRLQPAAKGKQLSFVIHRIDKAPSTVSVNGKDIKGWKYDAAAGTLTFDTTLRDKLEIKIF